MLAGVSHDLRTPLTRMKLALEMLGERPGGRGAQIRCRRDGALVDVYLDFARGEGTEAPVETESSLLLEDIAAATRREGTPLSLGRAARDASMPVRPNALRRCLGNLIGNARRYGSHVWLTGDAVADGGRHPGRR